MAYVTGPGARERRFCPVCRGEPVKPAHRWSLGTHLQREHRLDLLTSCVLCWEGGTYFQSPKWSDLRRHLKTHHLEELDEQPQLGMWCLVPYCPRRYINCTRQYMVPLPSSREEEIGLEELLTWGQAESQPWEAPHGRRRAAPGQVPAPSRPSRRVTRQRTQPTDGEEERSRPSGSGRRASGDRPLMPRALQDPETPETSVPSSPMQPSGGEGSPQPGPSGYQRPRSTPENFPLESKMTSRADVNSPEREDSRGESREPSSRSRKNKSPRRHQAPTVTIGAQVSFMSSDEEAHEEVVEEARPEAEVHLTQPLEELAAGSPSVSREDWVAWERVSRRLEGSSPGGVSRALRQVGVTASQPSAQLSRGTQCQTLGRSVRVQASAETKEKGVMVRQAAVRQSSVGVNTNPPRPLVLDTLPDGDIQITIPGLPGMTAVLPPLRLDPSQPQ
jgi:hypothetical protein